MSEDTAIVHVQKHPESIHITPDMVAREWPTEVAEDDPSVLTYEKLRRTVERFRRGSTRWLPNE